MTAILTTLLLALPAGSDDPTPRTRSHNLHSEILLTLHTNNIISEAIKKFGISNTTSAVLIVRFGDGEQEEVWNAMDNVVEGELAPLSTLDGGELVDWKALDKVCPDTVHLPPRTSSYVHDREYGAASARLTADLQVVRAEPSTAVAARDNGEENRSRGQHRRRQIRHMTKTIPRASPMPRIYLA